MKRVICTILIAASMLGYAQKSKNIDFFINETKAEVTINNSTSTPSFITFPNSQHLKLTGESVTEKVQNFISTNFKIFNLNSAQDLVFVKEFTDNYGLKNVFYAQVYKGVPVYDGVLKFHFNKNEELTSINGNIIPNINDTGIAEITKQNAIEKAKSVVKDQKLSFAELPLEVGKFRLLIFPKGLAQNEIVQSHLAYEIEITNKNDVREYLYIDAHTGKIVEQFTGIHNVLDRKLYETNTTNPTNLKWSEGDPLPGTLDQWQQNEVITSEHVYNFFKNAFNYISYDGADHSMTTINNNPNISCPNANWNGTTANYCTGTAADDVVAHEWGHAYTEYTSELIYSYQSGAINESYSDVWGETIDLLNNYQDAGENLAVRTSTTCTGTQRWKMGEDTTSFGGPIRDMWNPNCNNDPGNMNDTYYHCATTDSGGVHINSGVGNRLYSLLVDGGTYGGYTITPIGFTKAAHLWWRAQAVYLTSTSGYETFANALEASFNDLVGINLQGLSTTSTPAGLSGQIFAAGELQNLQNALLAVKLRTPPPASCNFLPILAAAPALCTNATSAPLFQETWENGMGNWTVSNIGVTPTWTPRNWAIDTTLPKGRAGKGIFGIDPVNGNCSTDFQNGTLRLESPLITFPAYTAGNYEMAFNHYVTTENLYDGGNIKYSLNGGAWTLLPASAFTTNPYNKTLANTGNDNPIKNQPAFSGTDGGGLEGSWGRSVVNLSLIGVTPNSNIKFRFEMGTDGCNGVEGWYIDEVYVYNCSFASLSVEETVKTKGLSVYPNPTNGIITISNSKNINVKNAELYNSAGQLLKTYSLERDENNKLDFSKITEGIYILKVITKDKTQTFKIIKK
ncbi:Por secretion system C-terminal sorting domain-containing protein [Chryseobacterium piscicola]|uniref:Bacillolysin n=1 Tax=Chryseobacterium piscicola TaxID=551459 RepID=A0A1N7LW57_9FLAO|nr:M4 family metallopeptidase [Chryseobacterium piscicola]PQA92514.1 bacillolysin [Chryseobacterium piscicola]SIS78088.1 Por secretion system C-terminal sorting domain-containing protein [Chryseobacterium piscicola]